MDFPPFRHAHFLHEATRQQAQHNLAGSGFAGIDWPSWGVNWDGAINMLDGVGPEELKQELARSYDFDGQVSLTAGTSAANTCVIMTHLKAGDKVVAETPGYHPLAAIAISMGANVTYVNHGMDVGPLIAAMKGATMVLLTSPNNPTGQAWSAAQLSELNEEAARQDCLILVDQVYRELTDHAVAAHESHCITTAGTNKCWSAPGLRAGWLMSPDNTRYDNAHQVLYMAPSIAVPPVLSNMLPHRNAARHALETRLAANHQSLRKWLDHHDFSGDVQGLTAFIKTPHEDTWRKCHEWLAQGVAAVPGEAFGQGGSIRMGLGAEPTAFARALDALSALESNQKRDTEIRR